MKKWYRIGICVVLAVCLLLLPACKRETPPSGDPAQSTGVNDATVQNGENTGGSQGENISQQLGQNEEDTSDLPFAWTVHTIQTEPFDYVGRHKLLASSASVDAYSGLFETDQNIYRLNHTVWSDWTGYIQQRHSDCAAEGYCVKKTEKDNEPCAELAFFQNKTYTEEYFKQNTLLVLDILNNVDIKNNNLYIPFAFKELRYEENVLTAVVERQYKQESNAKMPWCIFIEINSALPADTELKLEIKEYNDPRLDALPKTLDFNWKETHTRAKLFFNETIGAKYKDSIYGFHYADRIDKFMSYAGMQLSYDIYTQLKADAEQLNLNAFESKSYTEEFFESNSLVLVNLTVSATRFEGLTDVRYENGVLTYYVQYDVPDDEEFVINEVTYDCLFLIEIDTVLPEGVEIRREIIPV